MERILYTWTWFLWLLITISVVLVMISIPRLVAAHNHPVLSEAKKLPTKQAREDFYLRECGSTCCIEVGGDRNAILPEDVLSYLHSYDAQRYHFELLIVLHIERTLPMRYVKEMKLILRQGNYLKVAYAT